MAVCTWLTTAFMSPRYLVMVSCRLSPMVRYLLHPFGTGHCEARTEPHVRVRSARAAQRYGDDQATASSADRRRWSNVRSVGQGYGRRRTRGPQRILERTFENAANPKFRRPSVPLCIVSP